MKRTFISLLLLFILQSLNAQKEGYYTNPILSGFYPDPSICRVDSNFYLVTSTFAYFPGLPVFHSKDLVNWTQIGHALDRPEQLPLIDAEVSEGLFAPAISHYKGTFYIACTNISNGGNFIITATDPAGPWSNPTYLPEVDGIDPSLFFDENTQKAYLVYNSDAPDEKPLWKGHRTIRMYEFDYINKKVTGEEKILINGGVDTSRQPVWIEGPHLYYVNDWYYLMCAEGGTEINHSEVIFRSKSPHGPFVPGSVNPILTQRHLNPNRQNPITTTGHADIVQTAEGKWYAVFLGCRPYEGNHYNTGRETFLTPVTWTEDGWPLITKDHEEIQYRYPLPLPNITQKQVNPFTGNFSFHDDFTEKSLNLRYTFLRTVTENWYNTTDRKGSLMVQLRPQTLSGRGNPSFVGFRQQHQQAAVTTKLHFEPSKDNEKAGLSIFQNENHYYFLCKSLLNGTPVIELYQSSSDTMQLLVSHPLANGNANVYLKIEPKKSTYRMFFSEDGKKWTSLKEVDAKFLSTETAGGFVGCMFGLYATSLGKTSNSKAYFDWFDYKGNDEIFNP